MTRKIEATSLGPDGYSRFFVILNTLERLYKGSSRTVRILDVGGCSPFLGELLRQSPLKTDLTILDILPKPEGLKVNYIQGDATKNDLSENSYDVVVSTDTLEHILPKGKDAFVRACVRLAKDACIIAAPFDTQAVHEAEIMVNDFNKKLFGVGQDWLEEHFEHKKPGLKATKKILDDLGVMYTDFGTNNLYSWLFSSHMNLIEAKIGVSAVRARSIREHYNHILASSPEFTGPTYRHFFVVYKNKAMAKADLPQAFLKKPEPETLLQYMHDMMEVVAARMSDLKRSAARQEKLAHERGMEVERLHALLESQRNELARLEPLRRLARLRHPKHALKEIKRRLTGKS